MKKPFTLLIVCLMLTLSSWAQQHETILSDGWQCQSSAVTDGSWYRATVPSTIMGVLTANGEYPNVLEGMNYKHIDKSRFDVPWIYQKSFDVEPLRPYEHLILRFEGISYSANIWLNDRLVAGRETVKGPFRIFEFDVTALVKDHNTLKVEVYRAQPGDPNIGFVDWNPRPADESMGLFRPVSIIRTGPVRISHPNVRSIVNLQTLDEAWLTVEADIENLSDKSYTGELRGELEGSIFSVPYTLKAHEKRTVRITSDDTPVLHVIHPRLWWCYTMGSPELYTLRLQFIVPSSPAPADSSLFTLHSSLSTVRFGIRQVGSFITRDGYRAFTLNGQRFLLTGAGWTDDIFLRDTPERYEQQLQLVKNMNLNTVRLEGFWGTSQALYDLCDSMGILLLAGWSCHWEWESYLGKPTDEVNYGGIISDEDIRLISQSYDDQVRYLRHHPSIIAWFTGSDRRPAPALEQHYDLVRQTLDDRPMIISAKELESDLSGTSGTKMAGPYAYVAPVYWYSDEAPGGAFGFNTETCVGASLPVKESIEQMLGDYSSPAPADSSLFTLNSSLINYHCTASASEFNSMRVLTETIRQRYGEATDLDDFIRKGSMVSYDGTRAMFEAFRYNYPRATGIVQWMLNGARPGLYWQLYDYYLRPTAAYYAVRKALQPVQLIYNYKTHEVRAVNSTLLPISAEARLTVYDTNGQLLDEQHITVNIPAGGHADAFKLKPLTTRNAFLFLEFPSLNTSHNVYPLSTDTDVFDWEKSDWTGTPMLHHADHKAIVSGSTTECQIKENHYYENGHTIVRLEVSNPTDRVAYFLHLTLRTPKGKLIDGVQFSDNYITLEPHGSCTVTCEFKGQQKFKAVITK